MTRRKMPDLDDRSEAVNDHVESTREEGEPAWDCDWGEPEGVRESGGVDSGEC